MIVLPHRPLPRAASALALVLFGALLTCAAALAATATDSLVVPPYTWRFEPLPLCAGRPATLVFEAEPCAVDSYYVDAGASANVVWTRHLSTSVPTDSCPPFRGEYALGTLAAGSFTVSWNDIERGVSANGTLVYRHVTRRFANFTVGPNCGPGALPFVDVVRIGNQPAPCDTCRPVVCVGDSIRVHFEGTLPSPCWHLESVHWLPVMSPLPVLGAVVVVSDSTCSAIPECGPMPTHWSADLVTGPQFMGDPVVTVSVYQKSCRADSAVVRPVGWRRFPFDLVTCPPGDVCVEPMLGIFDDSLGTLPCDVFAGPEGLARASLFLRTGVPLAGIQGRVSQAGGSVVSLQPTLGRQGWQIVTHPAGDGTGDLEFVLFSLNGGLIPPGTSPVLSALVRLDSTTSMGTLAGALSLASDSLGREAPLCVHIVPAGRAVGVCQSVVDTCDANNDGSTNVRDLVLMARCLRLPGLCELNTSLFDCNGDAQFGVPDLICCARRILHGGGPDSAQVHPADGIALSFGEPVRGTTGVDLPVSLSGADRVGAAVLQLQFPADRYELDGVSFTERTDWLQISDSPQPGRAEIGLVALAVGGVAELPATLRLRLKPGAQHGGEVLVASYDLSSPDGTRLGGMATGKAQLGIGGGPTAVALSAARPNPTGGKARFVVSLPRAADVDLGVYDLAGRRVATLAHARLGAGDTDVTWEARGVRDGVYFARLIVDGRTYASRVTVLRAR